MKVSALFVLVVAVTATQVGAIFAPRSRAPITKTKPSTIFTSSSSRSFEYAQSALAFSGGASSSDDNSGILQTLCDMDILVVDTEVAATEAAEHWGLILLSGVAGIAAGSLALYNPFEATDVAFLSSMTSLAVAGVIHTGGFLFAERGYKFLTLVLGLSQAALSAFMYVDPFDSELGLSLGVTMSVFADGLYRVVLAAQNPDLPARWVVLLGGLMSAATSVYVTKCMPLTFIAAPGIAMGVSLVTNGVARISVGLAGRDVANDLKKK